jgi:Tfp pilus assembly protein PilO
MISLSSTQLLAVAKRHRFRAASIVVMVSLALASGVLLKYQHSLSGVLSKLRVEGEARQATLVSGPQMRQELANVKEITHRIELNLVSDNLEENVGYFYQMEEQTKVHLDELHPLSAPIDNNPSFKRVPFSLRTSGNYQQLISFIYAIETGPRLANITSFGLRRRGNNSPIITLELSLELLGKK